MLVIRANRPSLADGLRPKFDSAISRKMRPKSYPHWRSLETKGNSAKVHLRGGNCTGEECRTRISRIRLRIPTDEEILSQGAS
ncbi:unnamed protein product, partial [Nesidiocoris tenuis]